MAKWIIDETYDDGYAHHKCSHCNTRALFDYVMEEDYDEGDRWRVVLTWYDR